MRGSCSGRGNGLIAYPYAHGDLLEQRNSYFYSPFGGEAFLSSWRTERNAALGDLPQAMSAPQALPDMAPTDRLLERLYRAYSTGRQSREDAWLLAMLVQRFEVSKRLHDEYSADFKPVDPAGYRDLDRYVRFAEVLDAAFTQVRELPCLNAMLKCLDTLTALRSRLGPAAAGRLARLIECERSHVDSLARRIGSAT